MKNIIRIVCVVAVLCGFAALAQGRQLVKTPAQTWSLLTATSPANQITGTCSLARFDRISRAIQAAGTEAPHGTVFSVPSCPWVGGAWGDVSTLAGVMDPRSLNDLGTYTITCTDIVVGTADPTACVTGGICGPGGRACVNQYGSTASYASRSVTIEVYNNLPTVSSVRLSGTSLISGTTFAHDANVTLEANASDVDGPVTVRWRIVNQPPGSHATLASAVGATTSIQFSGESNFGVWEFEATADDQQGERSAPQRISLTVANRTPHPTITGSGRVQVNSSISLMVSPDDDGGPYTAVQWEALPPGGAWGPVGMSGSLAFTMATSRMSLGTWRFRVRVTDNETPALTGTSDEFPVDVFNERPTVTAGGPTRIRVGQSFALTSMAADPDGGPVTVRWIVIQAPSAATVALGAPQTTYPAATHPGTWVFRAQAEDDEGETTNSMPVQVVVDADPVAAIEGSATITVRAPFDVRDISYDPDSECPTSMMASDPYGCHRVAPGETFTPLSPGLLHWTWYVDSVPAGYELFHPPGRIGESFTGVHSGYSRVLHVDEGQIPFGNYTLRVEVEDAEGNRRSASVQLRVLAPEVNPTAHINLAQRYLLGGSRQLLSEVRLSGVLSFDLDDALSDLMLPGPGVGISSYAWAIASPPGCSMGTVYASTPEVQLFAEGATITEDACMGVWNATLQVLDNDTPQLSDVRSQDFVIGRCAGEVCIDRPTHERPQMVDTGSPVDVPIYYYADPAVYARYPGGFYGVVDILPSGSSTPIYTLYDSTISTRTPGTLNLVHWHGERASGGVAPSGNYDVRVRISDTTGVGFGPSSDLAVMAILFEDVHVAVASTSTSYARYEDLEAGMNRPGFDWTITGAINVDGIRMEITRIGSGLAYSTTVSSTRVSGRAEWNGQTSTGTLLPPGDYEVRISALRGTRILATSTPWRLTVYRLRLGPVAPGPLAVGVNDDDDNRNMTLDRDELNVTGEDDLTAVAVSVEPPTMSGTVAVTPADGGTGVAVFMGPTKTAAAPASTPWPSAPNFYVEGRTPGRSALVLTFTPPTGPALTEARREVNVMGIEILNAAGAAASSLVPGLIENGATGFGDDVELHNDPGATFVDEDPSRFVVRVTDAAANLDSMRRERVSASVGTLIKWPLAAGESERWADDLTPVELLETDVDTGIFVSESQLLTNADEQSEPDDEFRVHSELAGLSVTDEGPGDRTHRIGTAGTLTFVSGGVRAQYGMMRPATRTVPICGRGPGDRIAVQVRARALMEPFVDMGSGTFSYDAPDGFSFNDTNGDRVHQAGEESEDYIDLSTGGQLMLPGGPLSVTAGRSGRGPAATQADLDRMVHHANQAWAPACLEVRTTGPLTFLDSPDLIGPGGLLRDGVITLDTERAPFFALFDGPLGPFQSQVIDVVMGFSLCEFSFGSSSGCHAYTDSPGYHSPSYGPGLIFYGTAPKPNERIFAHELGHGMTNGSADFITTPPWQFYPAGVTRSDDHYRYRHYPSLTGTEVRTPRPSPSLPGNAFISPF